MFNIQISKSYLYPSALIIVIKLIMAGKKPNDSEDPKEILKRIEQ